MGGSGNQAEINASKTAPSFVDISGSYQVKGDSIIGSVTVTPYITTANATFKLHMAVTEKYYINHNATTTQSEYRHVMRKMFPNGNGTSITTFTANTPQTFTFRDKFTVGNVTQNSHNFWWSPFDGHLIAFLQDDGTKEVLQSVAIPAAWPTDITETSSDLSDVIVYPNPASDFAIVKFNIGNDRGAKVTVLDALGKTVFETTETKARGIQEFHLPVSNLSSGIYQIRVQSAGHVVTQKLTVVD